MAVALRLVEAPQFVEHVDYSSDDAARSVHSLQGAFTHELAWQPSIVKFLINRFSQKGDLVLDAWCGSGHTALETVQLGRNFSGFTRFAALNRLSRARLSPADIAEVALRIQLVNLKRPIDVRGFTAPFNLFYDVDTFCELVNLRSILSGSADRVDRFVQFIVASVLHGHTVGHLSAYTSPHVALTQDSQAQLNRKRGEVPSYRGVAPRILKKAAALLQDGIPGVLERRDIGASISTGDARNLHGVSTGTVQLALLAPEQPGFLNHSVNSWLRCWWLGVDQEQSQADDMGSVSAWGDYTSEVLLEAARVVTRGGRAVVRVGQGRIGSRPVQFRGELDKVLANGLSSYWNLEGTVVEQLVNPPAKEKRGVCPGELVVLRRR
jgi:hypothetical protein